MLGASSLDQVLEALLHLYPFRVLLLPSGYNVSSKLNARILDNTERRLGKLLGIGIRGWGSGFRICDSGFGFRVFFLDEEKEGPEDAGLRV